MRVVCDYGSGQHDFPVLEKEVSVTGFRRRHSYFFYSSLYCKKIVLHTGEKWIIIVINLNSITSDVLYLARVDED